MTKRLFRAFTGSVAMFFISSSVVGQTATVPCTGGTASYKSGNVNNGGAITDGSMIINGATAVPANVRSWAVFDLGTAMIPAGATVTGVSFMFNMPSFPTGGGGRFSLSDPTIYGNVGDISSTAASGQGLNLYTSLTTGTAITTPGGWPPNPGSQSVTLDTAGVSFINNNKNGQITLGFSLGWGNESFGLTGYDGATGTQPTLVISYNFPLSMTIGTLAAVSDGNSNILRWNTLLEEKAGVFKIERSSNGRDFFTINKMDANGLASSYVFYDRNVSDAVSYYRLKLVEANSQEHYSKTVVVIKEQQASINAYPNPMQDILHIDFSMPTTGTATISLYDVTGKLVRSKKATATDKASLDVTSLPQGRYFLKYRDAGNVITTVVQK